MRYASYGGILEPQKLLVLCLAFVLGFSLARKYTFLKPRPAVIEVSGECIHKNLKLVQVSDKIFMCRLVETIR